MPLRAAGQSGVCLTYTYTIDPMPVTLSSFNAIAHSEAAGTQVLLDWTTISEINSDYFEVQKRMMPNFG